MADLRATTGRRFRGSSASLVRDERVRVISLKFANLGLETVNRDKTRGYEAVGAIFRGPGDIFDYPGCDFPARLKI